MYSSRWLGNNFLHRTQKELIIKKKYTVKYKIATFFIKSHHQQRERGSPRLGENVYNIYSLKGVLSKIYKEFLQITKKRADVTIEKLTKDTNKLFMKNVSQVVIQRVRKHSLCHHVNSK